MKESVIEEPFVELLDMLLFALYASHHLDELIGKFRRDAPRVFKLPDPGVQVGEQIEHMVSDNAISLFRGRRNELSHPAASFDQHCAPLTQRRAQSVDARVDQVVARKDRLVAHAVAGRVGE